MNDIHNTSRRKLLRKRRLRFELVEQRLFLTSFTALDSFLTANEVFGPIVTTLADLDGDNDLDLVLAYNGSIVWYENLDGAGSYGDENEIVSGIVSITTLVAADLDSDGDLDLASAGTGAWGSEGHINWYENQTGAGNFTAGVSLLPDEIPGAQYLVPTDLDGDTDLDLVFSYTTTPRLGAGLGQGGPMGGDFPGGGFPGGGFPGGGFPGGGFPGGGFPGGGGGPGGGFPEDGFPIDRPVGGLEINGATVWLENDGGTFKLGGEILAEPTLDAIAVDFDGDGAVDLLTIGIAPNLGQDLAQNPRGNPVFNPGENPVFDPGAFPGRNLRPGGGGGSSVQWQRNLGGGMFAETELIVDTPINAVHVLDFDNDGDIDVVVSERELGAAVNEVTSQTVYSNVLGTFEKSQVLDLSSSVLSYLYADLDRDGDHDLVALRGSVDDAEIVWFEFAEGVFLNAERLAEGEGELLVGDLEGDGDVDVLLVNSQLGGELQWFRNDLPLPASGDVNNDGVIDPLDIDLVFAKAGSDDPLADLDGNGRVDGDDVTYLVETILGTSPGDTDLDGDVDFADFLALAAGFGSEDRLWSEGDFGGDGVVDFRDFLILSASFGFESGS